MRRARGRRDRRANGEASRRRQAALFAIDTAISAGFALRAPGGGYLDILAPVGMASEIREPIIAALGRHRPEVVAILEFLDDQRGQAQVWVPRPGQLQ